MVSSFSHAPNTASSDFFLTRPPSSRGGTTPLAQRLQTITEDNPAPPIPPRSSLRNSFSSFSLPRRPLLSAELSTLTEARTPSSSTRHSAPPAYDWVDEALFNGDDDADNHPTDEKLAALRRGEAHPQRKWGWWRLVTTVALVTLALALAIGLGVGLTAGKRKDSGDDGGQSGPPPPMSTSAPNQSFPLGEFSMVTALKDVGTNCTSNPSTWSCYPYSVYDAAGSGSNSASLTTFNWVLRNTTATYATATTSNTPDKGIPANLSISALANPFGISFVNQSLTYISESTNSSASRYEFTFSMEKAVIPRPAITADNRAAECFFNQTTFTGTLYLSANGTLPTAELNTTSNANYTPWPYAVEVSQTSPGGQDNPACYKYVRGDVGARITANLTAMPEDAQCTCDYRNF